MVCDCAAQTANLAAGKSPSALTRRNDIPFHGTVNCAPAKGCVWPVLAPAQAIVRAGERRGLFGMRNAGTPRQVDSGCLDVLRSARVCFCGSVGAVYARCAPVFAVLSGQFALGLRAALRFCRGVCPRFARGLAALSRRFALGLRAALRLCRGALPSVCACCCGSVAALCARCASAVADLACGLYSGSRMSLRFCRGL